MEFFWMSVGIFIGSIVTNIVMCFRTRWGILKIDSSNPEKDIYRFEISDKELDGLTKAKRIMLRIEHFDGLSRK